MVTVMSRGLIGITYRLLVVIAVVLFLAEADTVDLFSLSKLTIWNMCVAIVWYYCLALSKLKTIFKKI